MSLTLKTVGFSVLIFLGLIIALAPVDRVSKTQLSPEELIAQLNDESIYVQPDELAHWIIDKDPGFQLVDLRSDEDYEKYNIPGNIHLPFEQLASGEATQYLDPDKMIILASNGNTRAGQAWIFLRQSGYEDVYILAGGLNYWVQVFSNPEAPKDILTNDELFTYEFRKAAGPAMMGTIQAVSDDKSTTKATRPKPVKRHKKKTGAKSDDGC